MIALLTTPILCTRQHVGSPVNVVTGNLSVTSFSQSPFSPPCLPRYPGKSLVGPISLLFGKSRLYSATLWFWYPWPFPLHPIGQSHHSWSSLQGQDFTMLFKVKHWLLGVTCLSSIGVLLSCKTHQWGNSVWTAQVTRYKPMSISLLRLCSF